MVSQLTFSQDNKIADRPIVELLRSLDVVLDNAAARHAATDAQLNQLVLILADGRFHEKEVNARGGNREVGSCSGLGSDRKDRSSSVTMTDHPINPRGQRGVRRLATQPVSTQPQPVP